ncbi:hypothetical protein U2A4042520091 [Corynebacterium striatum]|nr:hypothetical protein U2A4042520091 [Corynebacterium striatum]
MGLIPAYAGRTLPQNVTSMKHGAHPRLRGADSGVPHRWSSSGGSSPLTRGGPRGRSTAPKRLGLIPAYAGRTPIGTFVGVSSRAHPGRTEELAGIIDPDGAHPRLRGADDLKAERAKVAEGSSPLTRGGLAAWDEGNIIGGLIPAYAGRTSLNPAVTPVAVAHPRLRGADVFRLSEIGINIGSSPLTRGGPDKFDSAVSKFGLIPAYAGRTLTDQRGRAKNEASRSDLWCNGQCRRAFRAALQPVRR